MWRAWGLGALIAAGLILPIGTLSAANAPIVHVKAVVADGSVQLELEANGPFEYTTYRPSASLYVIDLSGVAAVSYTHLDVYKRQKGRECHLCRLQ